MTCMGTNGFGSALGARHRGLALPKGSMRCVCSKVSDEAL